MRKKISLFLYVFVVLIFSSKLYSIEVSQIEAERRLVFHELFSKKTCDTIYKNSTFGFKKKLDKEKISIISKNTSDQMNKILRKVVADEEGTASLANIFGYNVGGKTGTSKSYRDKNININTFISMFPSNKPKYVLLIILDNPKGAPHLTYDYKGQKISNISRTEAGWNSVYVAGKIIEKIGPILAINNNEVHNTNVVKKNN